MTMNADSTITMTSPVDADKFQPISAYYTFKFTQNSTELRDGLASGAQEAVEEQPSGDEQPNGPHVLEIMVFREEEIIHLAARDSQGMVRQDDVQAQDDI